VRIRYFTDIRFPLDRANGIQSMETCYALAQRGHAVTVFVRPDTARPARDPFVFYGLQPLPTLAIATVPVAGAAPLRRAQYLAAAAVHACASEHGEVVFTRDLALASYLLRIPRAWRPTVVFESHGLAALSAATLPDLLTGAAPATTRKQNRLSARDRRVWQDADGYVTITSALAGDLERTFGTRRHKPVAVIPDGVRLPAQGLFAWRPVRATPVIGYVGHLYPWKGAHLMIEALSLMKDVRAIVVGGHPAERDLERLKEQAQALGVGARVTFTGYVERSRVPALLADMDILALPHTSTPVSDRYASPLKLFEYMAAGRPIVASNLVSIREVLCDGVNAVLVEPGSPSELANGIRRVIDDSRLAEGIARKAHAAAADYTWDRRAARLEQLFLSVDEAVPRS
jgi:glycosyltransferase involved in cell wall biosynthesis